ncbi:MAG: HlyD family efflux transporter periplasmic adaptor subunit [Chloroflexi bacterium]|nr:HlyD family efflux transporter periplasmic adaptor subunit [Chloroflexota bacterium]
MKLKVIVILALVVVGGAAVFVSLGGLPAGGSRAETTYLTATAATGDVTDEVAATGTVASTSAYVLGFGTAPRLADGTATAGSGTWLVEDVNVAVGDAVKAEDVLATASTADLVKDLAAAKSSLAAARISEKQARAVREDASGTDAIRQGKIGVYNAVNGRRQAESDVANIRDQIALATLVAPIDGIVTTVAIAPGLEATGTAITIASDTYEVTADVVESDVSAMSIGQGATITVDAIDAVIGGTVSAIAPATSGSGSGSVVSFPVTVNLTGAPSALRAGMSADISIVTASAADVLTIPSTALRGTAGNYRVQVMGADGTPTPAAVEVGLVTDTTAEITNGLALGDVVVTGTSADRAGTTTMVGGPGGFGGGVVVPGVDGGGRRFQP